VKPGVRPRYAVVTAAVAGVLAASAIWFFFGGRSPSPVPSATDALAGYAALSPMAPADSSFALGYRKTPSPYLRAFIDAAKEALGATGDSDDGKRLLARRFLDESGISEADVRWAVASAGPVEVAPDGSLARMPDVCFAMSFSHDPAAIVAAYNGLRLENSPVIEPSDEVSGFPVWRVRRPSVADDGMLPLFTSLGGELLLAATSRAALEGLVALYAGDGRSQGAFSAALSGGDALTFFIPRFGETVAVAMEDRFPVAQIDAFVAGGSKKFLSLGEFTLTVAARESGGLNLRAALNTASDEDADELKALVMVALMKAKADVRGAARREGISQAEAEAVSFAAESLKGTSARADGATLVVNVPVSDAAVRSVASALAAADALPRHGGAAPAEGPVLK